MDQTARPLVSLGIAGLVTLIAAGAAGFGDETGNDQRLQSMPRERRVILSENLDRFDRLGPGDQAAIRKLDAALARMEPIDRAKYRAILRRYHLWVNGLSDVQKKELEAATDPDARFNLARKFRLAQLNEPKQRGAKVSGIRTGDYGLDSPGDVAFLLKVWNQLKPEQKAEISKRSGRELRVQIRNHAVAAGIPRDFLLYREEMPFLARLENDADFKAFVGPVLKSMTDAAVKKTETAAKKAEAIEKRVENQTRKSEHPYAEFLYFEDRPVPQVASKNLDRFLAACPPWLTAMLDPLAPEDARNYLTIVYRQLNPHPTEITDPAREKPAPRPAPKKGPGNPAPP